jgi:hypothetical protein
MVTAHFAAPIGLITVAARQQFAALGRFNDRNGAVRPSLRLRGVERYGYVQPRHRVRVHGGEDRRVLGDVEIRHVDQNLREILRVTFCDPVALEPAPAFVAERLVFPQTRILDTGQSRAVEQNAIGVTTKETTGRAKGEPRARCEFEAGANEVLTTQLFE